MTEDFHTTAAVTGMATPLPDSEYGHDFEFTSGVAFTPGEFCVVTFESQNGRNQVQRKLEGRVVKCELEGDGSFWVEVEAK